MPRCYAAAIFIFFRHYAAAADFATLIRRRFSPLAFSHEYAAPRDASLRLMLKAHAAHDAAARCRARVSGERSATPDVYARGAFDAPLPAPPDAAAVVSRIYAATFTRDAYAAIPRARARDIDAAMTRARAAPCLPPLTPAAMPADAILRRARAIFR